MKFTPKVLDDNVNVSKTHPLAELGWLVGGLTLITAVVFISLGLLSDWAVRHTPVKAERWLGDRALLQFPGEPNGPLQARLDALLAILPPDSPLHEYKFKVFLSPTEEVNAIALPGGNIVVYAGLLQQVESENELAMVLAHELGHFAHRDHLRGLGRGLGLAVISMLVFGENSSASALAAKTLSGFQATYSQGQESAADSFGLDLLGQRYGHVGGGTDFFARLGSKQGGRFAYILASHPHPQARVEKLEQLTSAQGYRLGTTEPLGEDLRKELQALGSPAEE